MEMDNYQFCGFALVFLLILKLSETRLISHKPRALLVEDVKSTKDEIAKIAGRKTPLKDSKSLGKRTNDWIVSYQGQPFDISILYILTVPFILGKLAKVLFTRWRPVFSNADKQPQLPLIPLVILQASRAERDVKRQPRNGIQWFGEKFLIHANSEFIDIDDAVVQAAKLDPDAGLEKFLNDEDQLKTYWGRVRGLVPFFRLVHDTKKRVKNIKGGKPLPSDVESLNVTKEEALRNKMHSLRSERICDIYNLKDFYTLFHPKHSKMKRKHWELSELTEEDLIELESLESLERIYGEENELTTEYEEKYIKTLYKVDQEDEQEEEANRPKINAGKLPPQEPEHPRDLMAKFY